MSKLSLALGILVLPSAFHPVQAQTAETKARTATVSGSVVMKGEPAQGVLVYLAIPRERSGVTNYTEEGDQLRYALRTRKVPDSARDDRHAEIQLALPNLVLLFGDESRDGFSALPIARVVRNESGSAVFSQSYIPPCLRIQCSSAVVRTSGCRRPFA